MNRYMVVAFLMIVPLYGIRKASEELVQGLSAKRTKIVPSVGNARMMIPSHTSIVATTTESAPLQLTRSAE